MRVLFTTVLPVILGVTIHFLIYLFAPSLIEVKMFTFHLVFFITACTSSYVVTLASNNENKTLMLLLTSGARLIAVLTLAIVILSRFSDVDHKQFFFTLLFIYLYYTSFELYFIIRTLRPNSVSGNK